MPTTGTFATDKANTGQVDTVVTAESLVRVVPSPVLFVLYIYIYIYIYCYSQTDCFIILQLFSVARHVGHFKLGLKPTQLYVRLSIILLSHQSTNVSSGIIRHYVVAFIFLHFALLDTRDLNSFEELCITQVAADNSYTRMLNPVIFINRVFN